MVSDGVLSDLVMGWRVGGVSNCLGIVGEWLDIGLTWPYTLVIALIVGVIP